MRELTACRDCCDEAQNQLARLSGGVTTQELGNKTCMQALSMFHTISHVGCNVRDMSYSVNIV